MRTLVQAMFVAIATLSPAFGQNSNPELNVPIEGAGPTLSQTEKFKLLSDIQKCWTQPTGLSEAADLRVVIGVNFDANGELAANPTLVEPAQVSSPEMKAVFETGRRAIIRCNGKYDLPLEKYEMWKYIEIAFNSRGAFGI